MTSDYLPDTARERRAVGVGSLAGFGSALLQMPSVAAAMILIALGVRAAPDGTLGDLEREPGFGIGGTIVGYVTGSLAVVAASGVI